MKKLFIWDYHGTLEKGNEDVVLAYSNMALFGAKETKHDKLKKYIIDKKFDHFVAIGDAPKDLEFVQEYPSTTYLYAHPGWNFRDYPATYKIRDLREILKEL